MKFLNGAAFLAVFLIPVAEARAQMTAGIDPRSDGTPVIWHAPDFHSACALRASRQIVANETQRVALPEPQQDVSSGPSQDVLPGFVLRTSPPLCLVPQYPLVLDLREAPPLPMPPPAPLPVEEPAPPPQPPPSLFTTVSILSVGNQPSGNLSMPALQFAGMALVAKTFGSHVTVEKDWRTSQALLRLHADVGRWHPFIEGSMLIVDPRIVTILLPDSDPSAQLREDRRIIQLIAIDAAKNPYWFAGTTVDLGRGFSMGIGGTALYIGDKPFFAGAVILTVPFGLHPFGLK